MGDETRNSGTLGRARQALSALLTPLDRVFNRIFSSRYNPLFRSGTLAMGFIAIAMATGLYLLLFYRIGAPYDSMTVIQGQVLGGRWVRAVHRYASDAAVVMVVLHVLRMIHQGKTWGPRTFAWVTGVVLAVMLFLSGWTGFVLLWDEHARAMAVAGASLLDASGIFSEPIGRAFVGADGDPPASFFFMILFLHIVIPLAMIFGVWMHTSRMKNAIWLPSRKLLAAMATLLFVLAITRPAPLLARADALRMKGRMAIDAFYGFWLPLVESPGWSAVVFLPSLLLLVTAPFWLRPRRGLRLSASYNDPNACQGCKQCVSDCPYEAIHMEPRRPQGNKSPEFAVVNPALCVSCGICAGSCESFTIGPAGRKASDQVLRVREFLTREQSEDKQVVVMACRSQPGTISRIRRFVESESGYALYPVDCAGTIHSAVIDQLAKNYRTVAIAACPERNCETKDGFKMISERVSGSRAPSPSKRITRDRIPIFAVGEGEEERLFRELSVLKDPHGRTGENDERDTEPRSWLQRLGGPVAGFALLFGVALASGVPMGREAKGGLLRLSWRLPGQVEKTCRERSAEELARLPIHMRTTQECARRALSYRLVLEIDGKRLREATIAPGGLHQDSPLYVEESLSLREGTYSVLTRFEPIGAADGRKLQFQGDVSVRDGAVSLIHLSPDTLDLKLKQGVPR